MIASIPIYIVYFFAGSGICSLLSMFLPSQHGNSFFQFLLDGMNLWAFNVNKAKNADDARK